MKMEKKLLAKKDSLSLIKIKKELKIYKKNLKIIKGK
jgi:hypothetical protein